MPDQGIRVSRRGPRARASAVWAASVLLLSSAVLGQCVGDCGRGGATAVDAGLRGVAIALGVLPVEACAALDSNHSHDITIDELVAALNNPETACPGESTPTATTTPPPTSNPLPTATAAPAVCGNHRIEAGETCDDGNSVTNPPTDTCPADCTIITCTPAGTNQVVAVSFTPPAGKNIGTLTVLLEYPDGTIQIPGTGDDDVAVAAIANTPSGFLVSSFDYDYALQVGLAGTRALTVGQIFRVTFANCQGAAPPTAAQLPCTVTLAKDTSFKKVDGVTCAATLQ